MLINKNSSGLDPRNHRVRKIKVFKSYHSVCYVVTNQTQEPTLYLKHNNGRCRNPNLLVHLVVLTILDFVVHFLVTQDFHTF